MYLALSCDVTRTRAPAEGSICNVLAVIEKIKAQKLSHVSQSRNIPIHTLV